MFRAAGEFRALARRCDDGGHAGWRVCDGIEWSLQSTELSRALGTFSKCMHTYLTSLADRKAGKDEQRPPCCRNNPTFSYRICGAPAVLL